jgi:hypothetical protein
MSGVLAHSAFAAFDMARYTVDLDGLRRAWAERKAIENDAAAYATASQRASLEQRFEATFAPTSKAVAEHALRSLPRVDPTVAGFLAARKQRAALERDVVPYLAAADRRHLLDSCEQRNVEAARGLLPGLPAWLRANIPPDKGGKNALQQLSVGMLDRGPEDLAGALASLQAPYDRLAKAIVERHELLKYQICDLPRGFEELKTIICPEAGGANMSRR